MSRLRVVAYVVQPQVVMDDGENLTPVNVTPVTIPAAEWPNVVEFVAEGIAQLQAQVETAPTPAAPPKHNGRVTSRKK